jgi:polyhydroxyalkanoate synthesis regulator phasin
MMDLLKKTLLAGVGAAVVTREKAQVALDEFVRQGKLNATDARIMAEKIAEQGRKEFDDLAADLNHRISSLLDRNDAETRVRLAALEERVRILEGRLTDTATRNSEP